MPRYLTKSRFKLALECPTKLYYTKKEDYNDLKIEDSFLEALAEGGFQVGELAKLYFPGGILVSELEYDIALEKTQELMLRENVIIFEAAFTFKNLFIRADIVIKQGNNIQLIEVKSKSFDPNKPIDSFLTNDGSIRKKWRPYLYDIAFQKYVLCNSYPHFSTRSYLMLVDKNKPATVDGLNQMFFIDRKDLRKVILIGGAANGNPTIGSEILIKENVDHIVDVIHTKYQDLEGTSYSFQERLDFLSEKYQKDEKILENLGVKCKNCEFKTSVNPPTKNKKSGYHECWSLLANFRDIDFNKPHILNIWNFSKRDQFIRDGKFFKSDVTKADLGTNNSKDKTGLSRIDRQELQIDKAVNNDKTAYLDYTGLNIELKRWKYPLHFIDFETTCVAIPFNKGMYPYDQIAFQFSHHIIYENGIIEHCNQWINATPGHFPNFDFIRSLKTSLQKDTGTIFRYSPHENTILNVIVRQLQVSDESDKKELIDWIKTITKSTSSNADKWCGERNMVDLMEVVLKYYYNPYTRGSNSLKDVLPAVLNSSPYLKDKYSKPVYGNEIKSLNFDQQIWITLDESGMVINPYEKLPLIHEGISNESLDELVTDEELGIFDGGAAMTAYAKMQFSVMTSAERDRTVNALLKYCELDTFAMVLLWEELNNNCKTVSAR